MLGAHARVEIAQFCAGLDGAVLKDWPRAGMRFLPKYGPPSQAG